MSARARALGFTALGLAVLMTQFGSAQADGGALDPAFGTGGVVMTPTPPGTILENGDLKAVALQADGKIVVGGHAQSTTAHSTTFAVARYEADGSLDSTFGTGGVVTTDFGNDWEGVQGLAIQPDGKIVAVGTTGGIVALARYSPDGSLDPAFGSASTPGTVQSDVIGGGGAQAVALQPDGKIVVAGGLQGAEVARYNADGSLDTSFGSDGVASSTHEDWEYATTVALTPSGKILVVGSRANSLPDSGPDRSFVIWRFNSDGSLDSSFGSGGVATITVAAWDFASGLALQPDGKIVIGGSSEVGSQNFMTLARLEPNGALDQSFGDGGSVLTGQVGDLYVYDASSLLLQPDGKIIAGGNSSSSLGGSGFGLARFLPDGSLDPSFGTDGVVGTAFGSDSGTVRATALQPDGKIVAIGPTWLTTPSSEAISFTLARYLTADSHALNVEKAVATGSGTVSSQPFGIACGLNCAEDAAQFADQSLVTLTAEPVAGSAVSWSGACAGSGRVCTVTMKDVARSVHVKFSRCLVPRLKGKRARAAKAAIRFAHCSVGRTKTKRSSKVAKGRVISQHPAGGRNLPAGSRVSVVISKGHRR